MSLVKNLLTQWWEDWGGKPDKGSIDEKPPELDEKMWEENQKIIDIVNKKTFQPGLRKRKEKIDRERRGLLKEGLRW